MRGGCFFLRVLVGFGLGRLSSDMLACFPDREHLASKEHEIREEGRCLHSLSQGKRSAKSWRRPIRACEAAHYEAHRLPSHSRSPKTWGIGGLRRMPYMKQPSAPSLQPTTKVHGMTLCLDTQKTADKGK